MASVLTDNKPTRMHVWHISWLKKLYIYNMMPNKEKNIFHPTIIQIKSQSIVLIVRKLKQGVQYYTAAICVIKYRVVDSAF